MQARQRKNGSDKQGAVAVSHEKRVAGREGQLAVREEERAQTSGQRVDADGQGAPRGVQPAVTDEVLGVTGGACSSGSGGPVASDERGPMKDERPAGGDEERATNSE